MKAWDIDTRPRRRSMAFIVALVPAMVVVGVVWAEMDGSDAVGDGNVIMWHVHRVRLA